jgi:hypothetical protein
MDIPKICLPNGMLDVDSIEDVEKCPWFWSTKRSRWVYRPEWVGLWASEQSELCEADEMWQ